MPLTGDKRIKNCDSLSYFLFLPFRNSREYGQRITGFYRNLYLTAFLDCIFVCFHLVVTWEFSALKKKHFLAQIEKNTNMRIFRKIFFLVFTKNFLSKTTSRLKIEKGWTLWFFFVVDLWLLYKIFEVWFFSDLVRSGPCAYIFFVHTVCINF